LYIGAAVFRWASGLLGGEVDSEDVRAALAWSYVPDIVALILFLPLILIVGQDWFSSSAEM
jgi:hypothetical protein